MVTLLALLVSRLDVGFVFFKWVALVLCLRRPRELVLASSGALVWKPVICGCCRVSLQKRLSYRLQALSSLFFAVMPSILRIRLDGWFSRCRGQSSGKSASRQRSYERYSRDVQESHESQEPIDVHAKSHAMFERAICDWRVVFQQSDLPLPTGGLSNPIVRMGRSPAHVQACWVDQSSVISHALLGSINLPIFIHV